MCSRPARCLAPKAWLPSLTAFTPPRQSLKQGCDCQASSHPYVIRAYARTHEQAVPEGAAKHKCRTRKAAKNLAMLPAHSGGLRVSPAAYWAGLNALPIIHARSPAFAESYRAALSDASYLRAAAESRKLLRAIFEGARPAPPQHGPHQPVRCGGGKSTSSVTTLLLAHAPEFSRARSHSSGWSAPRRRGG